MECNLVWNHTRDFKIEQARSASSIWNHKYDFRPKLHDPKFNYHFVKSIVESHCFIALRGVKLTYKSVAKEISKPPFKCFYSLLKIYNILYISSQVVQVLQVVDNTVFWQNVLLYFENDPLSPSF